MTRVPHALAAVSLAGGMLALQGCSDSYGDSYALSVADGGGDAIAYASVLPNGDGCAPVRASAGAVGDPA